MDSLPLNRALGRGLYYGPDDINLADRALRELGVLQTPPFGLTANPPETVFQGIEQFQRAEGGLKVDALMWPDGPTARKMAGALANRLQQPLPEDRRGPYGLPRFGSSPWPWSTPSSGGIGGRGSPAFRLLPAIAGVPNTPGADGSLGARPPQAAEATRSRPEIVEFGQRLREHLTELTPGSRDYLEFLTEMWSRIAKVAAAKLANREPKQRTPQANRPAAFLTAQRTKPHLRRRAGDSPTPPPTESPDDVKRAIRRLRLAARGGWLLGLERSRDYLEHFLSGTGEDISLTREEARSRGGGVVAQAESRARKHFEEGLLKPRDRSTRNGRRLDYQWKLLRLPDGKTIQLPLEPEDAAAELRYDHYEAVISPPDLLLRGELDEYLASKTSDVETSAHKPFTFTRRRDTIHVSGVVEHRWDDEYDFTKPGEFSEEAQTLIRAGRAKTFSIRSGWKQRVTGTIKIRDGQLVNPQFTWEDID